MEHGKVKAETMSREEKPVIKKRNTKWVKFEGHCEDLKSVILRNLRDTTAVPSGKVLDKRPAIFS